MPVLLVINFLHTVMLYNKCLLAPLLLTQQLPSDRVFAAQTAEVCVLFAVANAAVNDLSPY